MNISTRIDDAAVRQGLASAGASARRITADVVYQQVVAVGMPTILAAIPSKTGAARASGRVGRSGRGAVVAFSSPYLGLVNFGGTRHDRVTPKSGRALATPEGPRAALRGARSYPKRNFLQAGTQRALAAIAPVVSRGVADDLQRRVG